MDKILELEETIVLAECYCCGLKEECTKEYISRIRDSRTGKWVCGLCSEAVKERLNHHSPLANLEEAMKNITKFVRDFNNTTRVNPKLSLTWTMRDIAKKSGEKRKIDLSSGISTSCVPRADLNTNK
ncbi:hypothetical protein PHJA_001815100 [Phtheirospermum japonicum]|uniref:DUF1677 family protein n=1 Tax=Phtheirospermum japonicum TaxID=374723 RepID=A0A830CAS4_9LAMI|nr:hypothetical protein PHJA_001815100 [Phtheirospermum japonicum]